MNVALVSINFYINIGTVENTAGLSVPGSQVHDDLKSARSRKLVRKSEGKKLNRVYRQRSAAKIQMEVDSGMERFAADR